MSEHRPLTVFKSKAIAILAIVLVVALMGGALYYFRSSKVFINATTRQPERYTELYFSDPTHLPTIVGAGQQLPVSFVTHNREARTTTYTYTVSYVSASGSLLAEEQAHFTLPDGSTKTTTSTITVPTTYQGKAEVRVALTNLNQSIHYWTQIR